MANESKSGAPLRHRNKIGLADVSNTAETIAWNEARKRVCGAVEGGAIIVLTGPRGTGKTQISVEVIREASEKSISCLYTKAIEVFLNIREAMALKEKSERAALAEFIKPKVLVIDAMEERGETPFEDRMLNYVIDKRYEQGVFTLLITNQMPEAFGKSVGPSIMSRIHETGAVIECKWKNFRGHQ